MIISNTLLSVTTRNRDKAWHAADSSFFMLQMFASRLMMMMMKTMVIAMVYGALMRGQAPAESSRP